MGVQVADVSRALFELPQNRLHASPSTGDNLTERPVAEQWRNMVDDGPDEERA